MPFLTPILQSFKTNFSLSLISSYFVFGKGSTPSSVLPLAISFQLICFFFYQVFNQSAFFTKLVSHVPHGPHGTLEAPFRYEQSFRPVGWSRKSNLLNPPTHHIDYMAPKHQSTSKNLFPSFKTLSKQFLQCKSTFLLLTSNVQLDL